MRKWSSYPVYAYGNKGPDWLSTHLILPCSNGYEKHIQCRKKVQKYAREEPKLLEDIRHGIVVGPKGFVDTIRKQFLPDMAHKDLPAQRNLAKDIDLHEAFTRSANMRELNIDKSNQAMRLHGAVQFCFLICGREMTMTKSVICTIFLLIAFTLLGCTSDESIKAKHLEKAHRYFDNGEIENTIIELKNAIQIDPNYVEAHQLLAKAQLKTGNSKAALQSYLKIEQVDPENLQVKLELATLYTLARKKDEALKRVEAVLAEEPDNIDALYALSGVYRLDSDQKAVAETFQRIIALDADQPRALTGLARAYTAQGKSGPAEEALKKAVAANPKDKKAIMAQYNFYASTNQIEKARQTLMQAIEIHPDSADLEIALGNYLLQNGDRDKAEAAFKRALEKAPDSLTPYLVMAGFLDTTGRTEDAKAAYQGIVDRFSEDIRALTRTAEFYFKHNEFDLAGEYTAKILEIRPQFTPAQILKDKINLAKNRTGSSAPSSE